MTDRVRKKRGLGLRVTIIFAAVFLIVVMLTDALLYVNFRTAELARGMNRLVDDAQMVARLVSASSEVDATAAFGRFGVAVIWSGGVRAELILGSEAGRDWHRIAESLPPPGSSRLGASVQGEALRLAIVGERPQTVWVASASLPGTKSILQLASGLPESREAIRAFGVQLFGLSGLIAMVGFWVMLLVGASISRPILLLTRAADRIAAGDLSPRVRLERRDELGRLVSTFDTMAERIEESERGRARFMVDVSHELKTPLASIKAVVEAIINDRDSTEETRSLLGTVDGEVDRMTDLVRALVTYTRLEERVPKREQIRVTTAARRLTRLLAPRANQQGSQLVVEESVAVVEADPGMLDEMLLNLLDNALRHGGPDNLVLVGAHTTSGITSICVENSGRPIPAHILPRMFEPLSSGEASRSRTVGGSGLGLAIVRRIAEAHGWSITVDTSENRTRFTIATGRAEAART